MQASAFDELAFFQAIANSGARALLIGRQALIALGMPVMTADYDIDGQLVHFADVWDRRVSQILTEGVRVAMPCIDDLILTKRFGARPRDADDIRWLEQLRGPR